MSRYSQKRRWMAVWILVTLLLTCSGLVLLAREQSVEMEQIAFSDNPQSTLYSFEPLSKEESSELHELMKKAGFDSYARKGLIQKILQRPAVVVLAMGILSAAGLMVFQFIQIRRERRQAFLYCEQLVLHNPSVKPFEELDDETFEYASRIRDMVLEQNRSLEEKTRVLLRAVSLQKENQENILHQLRSALTGLKLGIGLLQELEEEKCHETENGCESLGEECLENMKEQCGRMENLLVDRLTDSTSTIPFPFHFESIELTSLIDAVQESVRPFYHSRRLEIPPFKHVRITGDFLLLKEALSALLENFADDPDDDNTVRLSIRTRARNVIFSIQTLSEAEPHTQTIPAAALPAAERYQSGRKKEGHFGIGQHLARQIIETHHGTLKLSMQSNQYICTITLPL